MRSVLGLAALTVCRTVYPPLKNKAEKEKAHRSGPQQQTASSHLVAATANNAEDRKQIGKDVVNVEVNRQGS